MRLLAFAASLRQSSINRRVLAVAVDIARRHGAEVDVHPFAEFEFPYYNGDVQAHVGIPEEVTRMGRLVQACDGVLLASPEYNYSLPGTLKNTIDWLSRIKPSPLRDRWVLLLSSSNGVIGGIRGLWQLRIPLEGLGAFVYPDMYALPQGAQAFDDAGHLKEPAQAERLEHLVKAFVETVRKARG